MGNILKKMGWDRSSYLVSSKAFFGDGGRKPTQTGLSRKHLFEACHDALDRLQLDYLDLFFCHRPDKNTPMEETVFAMNHLIQQGKILYWGTSEWSALEIMEAHMVAQKNNLIGPVMEQPQYNMFHRRKVEVEFHKLYSTVGLGTTIWSPLASGTLTDKFANGVPDASRLNRNELAWLKEMNTTPERMQKVQELSKLAGELGVPLAQMAIAWCLKNEHVSTVILGASKMHQLKENLKSLEVVDQIDDSLNDQIEKILGNQPHHPPF
jgi:voltage-dependent potassium channel beta subunit